MNDLVATQTCGTTGANSLSRHPECLPFRQKRNGVKRSGEISRCNESFIRPISGNSTRISPKVKKRKLRKRKNSTAPKRGGVLRISRLPAALAGCAGLGDGVAAARRLQRKRQVGFLPCAPRVDKLVSRSGHVAAIALNPSNADNVEVRRFRAVDQVGGDVVVVARFQRINVLVVDKDLNSAAVGNQAIQRAIVAVQERVL